MCLRNTKKATTPIKNNNINNNNEGKTTRKTIRKNVS